MYRLGLSEVSSNFAFKFYCFLLFSPTVTENKANKTWRAKRRHNSFRLLFVFYVQSKICIAIDVVNLVKKQKQIEGTLSDKTLFKVIRLATSTAYLDFIQYKEIFKKLARQAF